jgi:hypothetical protein
MPRPPGIALADGLNPSVARRSCGRAHQTERSEGATPPGIALADGLNESRRETELRAGPPDGAERGMVGPPGIEPGTP